jgi:hypothetical protein
MILRPTSTASTLFPSTDHPGDDGGVLGEAIEQRRRQLLVAPKTRGHSANAKLVVMSTTTNSGHRLRALRLSVALLGLHARLYSSQSNIELRSDARHRKTSRDNDTRL